MLTTRLGNIPLQRPTEDEAITNLKRKATWLGVTIVPAIT
jgi:hypothetical protein